jgi:hypothetical protein
LQSCIEVVVEPIKLWHKLLSLRLKNDIRGDLGDVEFGVVG